jgi:hypothetical protein
MMLRAARAYFALQAVAVAAWWLCLWRWPSLRAHFRPAGAPDTTLLAFAPGDAAVALASAALAVLPPTRARTALAWTVAGGIAYATAYTIALAVSCAAGPLGAILMTPAAAGSLLAARALHHADPDPLPDRRSR